MTAKIMQFTGRRIRQPLTAQAGSGEKVPAPVTRLTTADEERMQGWAEEKMRDAIRIYRAMFTSQELVMRLARAAEDELKLIEADAR